MISPLLRLVDLGDKQWFNASCRRAYYAKQTAYRDWCRPRNADHLDQFVLSRAEVQWSMVR